MTNDELREQAQQAAAEMDLSLSRATVLELAVRLRRRMAEALRMARPAEAR